MVLKWVSAQIHAGCLREQAVHRGPGSGGVAAVGGDSPLPFSLAVLTSCEELSTVRLFPTNHILGVALAQ